MTSCAPRLTPRLLRAIDRIDDGTMPFAELCRRVGRVAAQLDVQRPSYERVRVLAHRNRDRRRRLWIRPRLGLALHVSLTLGVLVTSARAAVSAEAARSRGLRGRRLSASAGSRGPPCWWPGPANGS